MLIVTLVWYFRLVNTGTSFEFQGLYKREIVSTTTTERHASIFSSMSFSGFLGGKIEIPPQANKLLTFKLTH